MRIIKVHWSNEDMLRLSDAIYKDVYRLISESKHEDVDDAQSDELMGRANRLSAMRDEILSWLELPERSEV
jgi:hypothetical protein